MKRSEPIVRPATREDIDVFFGPRAKPTMKAWVGVLEGKPIGIGGLALVEGRWIAFCDLTPEARRYKRAIVKTAKMIMEEAGRCGIRFVYAEADRNEPMAIRWLVSLAFQLDRRSGNLCRWRSGGADPISVERKNAAPLEGEL
jgi:hypothetical protein